uniref:G kinase-anchoring protein 1 n=1 Tax=Homalodisca liturata TaxID=320908 RepID=A0A1B6K3T7_9HEMI
MVTPLASRFAVLPIDDDGDTSKRIKAKNLNKKKEEQPKAQTISSKKPEVKKKNTGTKKKTEQPASAKQKPAKPKNDGSKKKPTSQEQWEQWKLKDAEFVDGHYEDDLQQAMLLSKLDYEEKQDYYDQIKKSSEEEKKGNTKKNKKSNKAQPMSLSQFNQLSDLENQIETIENGGGSGDAAAMVNGKQEPDPEFFERIKTEAKKAFQSEQAEEKRKAREPHIDELISVAQYQDRLEKCYEEITRLKEENYRLQGEVNEVKTRSKKLCHILLQAEMKDKATILVEVHELQRVKNELSDEVSSLVAQLEQEKSKVRALTGGDAKAKDKFLHKRSVRFNAASETTRSK